MGLYARLLSGLVLTYLVSRLTLRMPNPLRKAWGVTLAHLVSLVLVLAVLALWRGSAALSAERVLLLIPPQVFWWLADVAREHGLGFIMRGSGQHAR